MSNWTKKSIAELGGVFSGATPKTSVPEYWDGEVVWVTPNDLSELGGRYIRQSERTLSRRGYESCSTHLLPVGSIVMSSRAPIGYLAIAQVECCTNQGCKSIVLKKGQVPEFHYYNLLFNVDRIKRLGEDTTFSEVNKRFVEALEFDIPESASEQEKVAEVLTKADDAIARTEALIAKYQRVRTGLMQDLLTKGIDEHGRIRSEATHAFKDSPLGRIPVEWDVCPASKLCLAVIDCKNRTPPVTATGHPVLRTPNVRGGRFVREGLVFTDPDSYETWTLRGKPQAGDVLITREAPVGEVCILPEDMSHACLGQRMMMYRPNPVKLSNKYMLAALMSERVQKYLIDLAGGSTVGHVRVGDIRTLPIPYPKLGEQQKIADVINNATAMLDGMTAELSKLRRIGSLPLGSCCTLACALLL